MRIDRKYFNDLIKPQFVVLYGFILKMKFSHKSSCGLFSQKLNGNPTSPFLQMGIFEPLFN